MKFLCDRCKTRYSIGDDRVRGKILKIRCKNCANVITVREGMEAGDDGAESPRRSKATTQSPPADVSLNATTGRATGAQPALGGNGAKPANALGAAFAPAMSNPAAKPPPALEEEWYVSIEGEQSGPFSLAEAQRWVASKAWDAELHCWSEGFDDWLPVDKVSHFRGLRKKPVAPTPPPLPRAATSTGSAPLRAAGASTTPAPVEDEPKPLFAATMASLEKAASASPAPNPRATPAGGVPAVPASAKKVNGSSSSSSSGASAPAAPAAPASAKVTPRPNGGLGGLGKAVPGFDVELNDQATQIGVGPFEDDAAEPARASSAPAASNLRPFQPKTPLPTPVPTPPVSAPGFLAPPPAGAPQPLVGDGAPSLGPPPALEEDDDEDLDIGEVSRVVNLNDLVKNGPNKKPRARTNPGAQVPVGVGPVIGRTTGSATALRDGTGAVSRIDLNTGMPIAPLAPGVDPATLSPLDPNYVPDGALPAPPTAQHANRRMLIMLGIGVALLIGVVVVVVMVFNTGTTMTGGTLHAGPDFSTTRPDELKGTGGAETGGTVTPANPQNPFLRKNPTSGGTTPRPTNPIIPTNPPPSNLPDPAEEIEDLAQRNSGLTSRCFLRASKGANAIIVGDVKKLVVTLSVASDGAVTGVTLDGGHQSDALGQCLVPVIKSWKFKPNKGGMVRLTMAAPKSG